MTVLIDTNVILDVLTDDPSWGDWSDRQLHACRPASLIVNPIIFSELCVNAPDLREVNRVLRRMQLRVQEVPRPALFSAAKAFLNYRRRGGVRTAPLPDFFIGAHAEALEIRLLTRDPTRFRTYFPAVSLICP